MHLHFSSFCVIISMKTRDNHNFCPLFIQFSRQQFGNKKLDSPSFMDN